MNTIQFVRIYHAALAVLAILAYLSAELGIVHVWLGYSVALVIILRLMWVLSGNPNVGLMRFYPSFEGLKLANAFTHPAITKVFMLGIAVSLLATTATGIAMDKGKAIGLTQVSVVSVAYADDSQKANKHQQKNEEGLKDSHEFFANLLVFFVGLHVCYLLVFKRPLAKFMVFMPKKSDKNA